MQTGASMQIEETRKFTDRITVIECLRWDATKATVAEDGPAREMPSLSELFSENDA